MKQYFIIYHHCFFSITEKEIFIFNPHSKKYIRENLELFKELSHNSNILLIDNKSTNLHLNAFINKCVEDKLGYTYNTSSDIKPFSRSYNIRFISSLQKMRNAIGYDEGFNIAKYISEITIFTGNNNLNLPKTNLYNQINYPIYNTGLEYDIKLLGKYTFPNLNTIIISGDINDKIISDCLALFHHHEIVIKTYFNKDQLTQIKWLLEKYKSINLQILISDFKLVATLLTAVDIYSDRVEILPIIKSTKEFNLYSTLKSSFLFIPLIYDLEEQKDLMKSMLINEDDIISINQNLDDIYINGVVNMNLFGHITINTQGIVLAEKDIIGDIKENFLELFNIWIHKKKNIWFYTRNNKKECLDCNLRMLCPPITIYERESYITTACRI